METSWTPPQQLTRAAQRVRSSMASLGARAHDDQRWLQLAIELFHAQYEHIYAYRAWCDHELAQRSMQAADVTQWTDIPALPIAAFKRIRVAAQPAAADVRVWESSGTTAQARSQHALPTTELCNASLIDGAREALCGGLPHTDRRVIQLTPPGSLAPRSSLAHMFDAIRTELGADGGTWADHTFQVDVAGAWESLERAIAADEPVLLLATSFAVVQVLDATADRPPITLPPGSALVDTGGYKGRTRELTRSELLSLVASRLGIDPVLCENEYGMSELSSQAWLGTIARYDGRPLPGTATREERWQPAWFRTRVVDPATLQEVEDGEVGLLVHHDLANAWSCACIRTEDIGVRTGSTYIMIGRAPGAELKGCSLRVEDVW